MKTLYDGKTKTVMLDEETGVVNLLFKDTATGENGMFDQEWGYVKTEAAVLECVIPKGTLYFEGRANCILGDDEEKGYTSSKLIPVREIGRAHV